ncbi:MAG: DUF4982 domain-containing protein, partial [Novosphingobium sp.]
GKVQFVSNWGWPDELPMWTWPGRDGQPMTVRVYARAERVELVLNGVKVAERALGLGEKVPIEFEVPYAAGSLEAIAWRGGRAVGRRRLDTAGPPAALRLAPEHRQGSADRQALHYVAVDVVDAAGRIVPEDARPITLAVSGPAQLVAFGSANPQAVGSLQALTAQSFRGRALAILRSAGTAGTIRVAASAAGLRGASAGITLVQENVA